MSYCRFSDGDVYLYARVGGGWECCACRLHDEALGSYGFDTIHEVKEHLERHIKAGDKVPQYAIDRVNEEIDEQEANNDASETEVR